MFGRNWSPVLVAPVPSRPWLVAIVLAPAPNAIRVVSLFRHFASHPARTIVRPAILVPVSTFLETVFALVDKVFGFRVRGWYDPFD